jgi:hypothetical protein
MKFTVSHVKRVAWAAFALGVGALALADISPDLTAAPFIQRFHVALVLIVTTAWVLSVLRSMAAGTAYGAEPRLLSGAVFLAWATYIQVWRTPTASPSLKAIALVVAAGIAGLIFAQAVSHLPKNRSA